MAITNKKVSTSVSIDYELWKWVKEHPEFTLSGLLESAIRRQMLLQDLVELNDESLEMAAKKRRSKL